MNENKQCLKKYIELYKDSHEINLENLPYCKKILNKKISNVEKGIINGFVSSGDKKIIDAELNNLIKNIQLLKDKIISLRKICF